ncbi:MAG: UDP-3-O-(3-hydroxymyristoyl)glucosamine N-acyltransferase [Phycisphaerales bacterium]|nr:UDP-3-O-(3-hydroxymyristoyl)glucosamine N-acyltransferase [Phycisphaerales bacterium]
MARFNTAEVAERVGGTLEGDGSIPVEGVSGIGDARADQLTFANDANNARLWQDSKARSLVTGLTTELPERTDDVAIIRVKDPELAMISMLEAFAPEPSLPPVGIHPTAIVDPSAKIGTEARIGPSCQVHEDCVLGDDVTLTAGTRLHRGVTIGSRSTLHDGVIIRERCTIGSDVVIHANVVIGTDGFGFRPSEDGNGLVRFPHIGSVVIEDDVEIGACTCIDRGKFGATRIGTGTKIDNLCQIGHNCDIGRCCVLCGQVGVAGSTKIGDGTMIGGAAGIADHLVIGRSVSIGARSGVINDIPDGETWVGTPAGKRSRIMREIAAVRRLPDWSKQLRRFFSQNEDGKTDAE